MEEPKVLYEDGVLNLFLYTKGRNGAVSQELKDLLRYLENTTWNNAVNDSLKEVQTMVDQVKQNKEVSISYMMLYEREQRALRRAREEARDEGLREGLTDSIKSVLSELGAIPEDVAERVSGEDNRDILERWLKLAARSDSIEEFMQKM